MPKKPTKISASETPSTSEQIHPATLTDSQPLPRLVVFDLDYTLWPFWVDTHVTPPLKANADHGSVKDKFSEAFSFYSHVPSILSSLRSNSILVGAASRTSAPELARDMLRLLHVDDHSVEGTEGPKRRKAIEMFDHMEIYPGNKITHFERLRKTTGVEYEEMLFFDDERRNRNVETLGVTMYLVTDGVTREVLDEGVREWRKRKGLGGK